MTIVTIPENRGGSGVAYSDDGSGPRPMNNRGHKTWFLRLIAEIISLANFLVTIADNAANAAADASNYAEMLVGASATSLSIGTGSKALTASAGKGWVVGQQLELWRAGARTTRMGGQVTAYTRATGELTVDVEWSAGSGTYTDWMIGVGGARGATGSVSDLPASVKTSAYTLGVGDKGTVVSCSGTWTLGATAAATLADGWWAWVENTGTGVITLDPAGAETVNGASTLTLRAGSIVLLRCDGSALKTVVEQPRRLARLPIFDADAASATSTSSLELVENSLPVTGLAAAVARIVWGNSMFVASTGSAAANVATSPDGITWTLRSMPSAAAWQVATDGAQFIATVPGATAVASSSNGTTWSSATALPGVAWDRGHPVYLGSVALALSGAAFGSIYRSTDNGSTWSTQALPANPGNAAPMVVGSVVWYWASGTTAYTSATGLTGSWTARSLPIASTGNDVWQDNDGALLMVNSVGSAYYRSTDGINWTLQAFTTPMYGTPVKVMSINGVWCACSSTFGSCATLHAGAWAIRRSAATVAPSTTVRNARNSAATVFVATGQGSGGEVVRIAPAEASAALSMFAR